MFASDYPKMFFVGVCRYLLVFAEVGRCVPEKCVCRCLSVFAGGFCGLPEIVLHLDIAQLVLLEEEG